MHPPLPLSTRPRGVDVVHRRATSTTKCPRAATELAPRPPLRGTDSTPHYHRQQEKTPASHRSARRRVRGRSGHDPPAATTASHRHDKRPRAATHQRPPRSGGVNTPPQPPPARPLGPGVAHKRAALMRAHREPTTAKTARLDNSSNNRCGQEVHSGPNTLSTDPTAQMLRTGTQRRSHEASLHLCTSALTVRCSNSATASQFILAHLMHEFKRH